MGCASVLYQQNGAYIPPVWTFFDKEQLWQDIQQLQAKQATESVIEKIRTRLRLYFLRQYLAKDWQRLREMLVE
ncbi:DUF7079 family protein [Xenorhabdus szentirmaii]|uniref:DUF7079 domain-containing protein n=1 Tax=Xenorhabdus szentirmaii DSM 16338 TaxID=1427518 RepID=W1J294_9GAMM|nr:hypothetical protein [Xenorhabdus szentirmaii]PHM34001.1 hypothetical protein Xsze_00392 [Xenorhabdus szentirmaii DSM 16338]CDL84188.1 hypothetical protein XSR1_400026 [Xenorhabdus szentirmaii DSM 16338]